MFSFVNCNILLHRKDVSRSAGLNYAYASCVVCKMDKKSVRNASKPLWDRELRLGSNWEKHAAIYTVFLHFFLPLKQENRIVYIPPESLPLALWCDLSYIGHAGLVATNVQTFRL